MTGSAKREAAVNVLVPASGLPSSREVLFIAEAVLRRYGGTGTVLSVVEVPEERSLSEGALIVRRRRSLLRRMANLHDTFEFHPEVRTAHSIEQGIRSEVEEKHADLMMLEWKPGGRRASVGVMERLVANPPCDLAAIKGGALPRTRSVLVPARGGPHARLALRVAEAIAARLGARLTLLHVSSPRWDEQRRRAEEEHYQRIARSVTYPDVERFEVTAQSIEDALMAEGAKYDMIVMGASGRDERSSYLFGRIPEKIARRLDSCLVVAKTREPVTADIFGLTTRAVPAHETASISEVVDRWFAENTFHSHEFRNIRHLVALKERQGKSISVALPTLNEENTVGKIISTIKRNFMERVPLLDELIVIDSNSEDRTVEIAESLGVRVFRHPDVLPQYGTFTGKGEGLWKSLYVTRGDIVAWIDSDISDFQPKFVYGLIGPLLTDPDIGFVKGFYLRPLKLGEELMTTGGGRVTELTARPLINLFYPLLSGVVQPLAGEMAGRRDVLESVPFFTGYGVETGLLIDILEGFGLNSIAQADLEYRIHRNQSLLSLSKMAFAIVQVVLQRLGDRNRLALLEEVNTSMKLIHYSPTELFLEVKEIREHERPAIKSLVEYEERFRMSDPVVAGPI